MLKRFFAVTEQFYILEKKEGITANNLSHTPLDALSLQPKTSKFL